MKNKLKQLLDPARYAHSLRVQQTAEELARAHGVDVEKASLAGLLHDYGRKFSRTEMLTEAKKLGLPIDQYSQAEPKLLHSKLSALLAAKDFGITDKEVLSAIEKHTLGSINMTPLEKIIYLADHVEAGREHPEAKIDHQLALKDLDQAVAMVAAHTLQYIESQGLPAHPGTLAVRDHYQKRP